MGRKVISLFTLLSFMVFSYSCYTIGEKKPETVARLKVKKLWGVNVLSVTKKSGEKIVFRKGHYGKIVKGGVQARFSNNMVQKAIEIMDIQKIVRDKQGNIIDVHTMDGRHIEILGSEEGVERIHYLTYESDYEVIPFSELKSIQIKYYDSTKTFLLVFGITVTMVALVAYGFAKMLQSMLTFE